MTKPTEPAAVDTSLPTDPVAALYTARCRLLRATVGLSPTQLDELAASIEHMRATDGDDYMLLPIDRRRATEPEPG